MGPESESRVIPITYSGNGQSTTTIASPQAFRFRKVEKIGGPEGLGAVVRLSKTSFTVGETVAQKWTQTRYKTPASPSEAIKVAFEVDVPALALRIYESADGFAARLNDSGSVAGALPRQIVRLGLPSGDYVQTKDDPSVFVLAA